jgi:hypothetical protein
MGHQPHANIWVRLLASRHRPNAGSGRRAGECEMPVTTKTGTANRVTASLIAVEHGLIPVE